LTAFPLRSLPQPQCAHWGSSLAEGAFFSWLPQMREPFFAYSSVSSFAVVAMLSTLTPSAGFMIRTPWVTRL